MIRIFFAHIPWRVLGLLVVLVLLIEGPLIVFPFYAGEQYRGINIAHYGNDEHYYLTRAKEVLEGHGLGAPHLKEGKEKPDPFQTNIEQILLFPSALFGLGDNVNPVTVYNILNSIGVLALLLLMYFFLYGFSRDPLLSVSATLFAGGAYMLIEYGTIIGAFLSGRELIHSHFNLLGRSIYPYTILVPFFGLLVLSYRASLASLSAAPTRTLCAYALTAGALFGLLFYIAFYGWTFSLAFLGSLFLSALIFRKWHAIPAVLCIGITGLLIGAPKLYGLFSFYTSEMGEQLTYFFHTYRSHDLILSKTGIALSLFFALYLYLRRDDRNNFFLFALVLTGWVALEQQVITGVTVEYGHFYWYFIVPNSILVGTYMAANLFPPKWNVLRNLFLCCVVVVSLLYAAASQYRSFFTTVEWKMREQDFAPILQALNERPYGVVLGDPGGAAYPLLVTILTDNDIVWTPGMVTSLVSMEYYENVLLTYLYLHKDARQDPAAYLSGALASTTSSFITDMYGELEGYKSGISLRKYRAGMPYDDPDMLAARPAFLEELGEKYRVFTSSPLAVSSFLKEQGVRYVLHDTRERPELDFSVLRTLTIIATSTDIKLYELP
ncbi:hypothetical protein HY969_01480 [Candidatus Kaiserbacteria bacterium]|nr:hypothetical protein [Candidatus Kaiserbacteria bacterium]